MRHYRFAIWFMILCTAITAGCNRTAPSESGTTSNDRQQAHNNAMQYLEQGNTLCMQGEYQLAIENCTKAIELSPDLTNAYSLRGRAYTYTGAYKKAIMDFDTVLRLNPNYILAHFFMGNAYADAGDTQSAIDAFRAFVQRTDPDLAYLQEQAQQKIKDLENKE